MLENLELRTESLPGDLVAPLEIKSGSVGSLRIDIPWKSLTSKAAYVELQDVYLLLRLPRHNHEQNEVAKLKDLAQLENQLRAAFIKVRCDHERAAAHAVAKRSGPPLLDTACLLCACDRR